MPFGLEVAAARRSWSGASTGWSLVAERRRPGRQGCGGVPRGAGAALLLVVAGFLWLALWRERWRLAGLVPIARRRADRALRAAAGHPRRRRAARPSPCAAPTGATRSSAARAPSFEVENWLRADADPRDRRRRTSRAGVACDALGCVAQLGRRRDGRAGPDAATPSPRIAGWRRVVVSPLTRAARLRGDGDWSSTATRWRAAAPTRSTAAGAPATEPTALPDRDRLSAGARAGRSCRRRGGVSSGG